MVGWSPHATQLGLRERSFTVMKRPEGMSGQGERGALRVCPGRRGRCKCDAGTGRALMIRWVQGSIARQRRDGFRHLNKQRMWQSASCPGRLADRDTAPAKASNVISRLLSTSPLPLTILIASRACMEAAATMALEQQGLRVATDLCLTCWRKQQPSTSRASKMHMH